MQVHLNSSPRSGHALEAPDRATFAADVIEEVRRYMAPLRYAATPLHTMSALARELRLGSILIKDESQRCDLGSFKALGGAYAVIRLVLSEAEKQLGSAVTPDRLSSRAVRDIARRLTVACATDGNHGRSVTAGARLAGCSAVVFVHGGVSEPRAAAMRALGADVRRVDGSYDDSVAEAARVSRREGWHLVSDTAWPGNETVPARVMQGYLMMVDEALLQCSALGCVPTHAFLQAGVGGFAAAVAAHMTLRAPDGPTRFVVVEPERAACLFQSAIEHRAVRIAQREATVMAMLDCCEPSLVAWRILERVAHAFVTIDDQAALRAMQRLAFPLASDPFLLSGESGGAGLAAVMETACDSQARSVLGMDERSIVLVFNTEGATDPDLYRSLLADAGHVRLEDSGEERRKTP